MEIFHVWLALKCCLVSIWIIPAQSQVPRVSALIHQNLTKTNPFWPEVWLQGSEFDLMKPKQTPFNPRFGFRDQSSTKRNENKPLLTPRVRTKRQMKPNSFLVKSLRNVNKFRTLALKIIYTGQTISGCKYRWYLHLTDKFNTTNNFKAINYGS